jgi:hypothetical protein
MSDTTPQPEAATLPAETTEVTPTITEPAPAQETDTDWEAEAKKWEKRAKANKTAAERLREIEESSKSEAEKLEAAQRELAEIRAEKARLEVASAKGVPAELLAGPGDDLEAYADALAKWRGEQARPDEPEAPSVSMAARVGKVPARTGAVSIDAQIAAAEKANDWKLVSTLNAMKLGALAHQRH